MPKKNPFGKLKSSKSFKLKKDAVAWANKEKKRLSGMTVKKDINFLPATQQYKADIYVR